MKNNLHKKFEDLKNKGENSGFFIKKLLTRAGWKTWSVVVLIGGGLIILIISFLLGMTKKE